MKKFYLLILMFACCFFGYSQEKVVKKQRYTNYRALLTRPSKDTVAQKDIEELRLYPNPVTEGMVAIHTQKNLPKEISIYDVLGKEVLRTRISGRTLNVSALNAGIYIIKVTEINSTSTRKLVIK
ncbi:T9SS type A sorting domain-containing protein [Sinomicrobium sp.]